MAITYTVEECEAKIRELEAQLDKVAALPTEGEVNRTRLNLKGLDKRLQRRISVWTRRLMQARGLPTTLRRKDC